MEALELDRASILSLRDLLGYHLRRASLRDVAGLAAVLGNDIKLVPFTVVCMVHEFPGITAAEIGRRLSLQRANLAPLLADLDSRGLIERQPDYRDHRIQRLFLTEQGTRALAEWRDRVLAHEEENFRALTLDERETLRRLLSKVWQDE